MFCPNCGKPNQDTSRFCEECGAALVDNSTPNTVQYSEPTSEFEASEETTLTLPKFDFSKIWAFVKKFKFVLIPVLAVAIILGGFCIVGSSLASPKKVAEKYFIALTEGDYETMYQCLALPNDELINKETFTAYMQSYVEANGSHFSGVENFTIEELVSYDQSEDVQYGGPYPTPQGSSINAGNSTESMTKTFRVHIVDTMTGSVDSLDIPMVKQTTKTWLFFDNYKVSSADYIVKNFSIISPVKCTIAIDGIELDIEGEKGEDDTRYTYTIDTMFSGKHTGSIITNEFETKEIIFTATSDDGELSLDFGSMDLKKELADTLKAQAISDYKALYKAALEQKEYSALSIKLAENSSDIENLYQNLKSRLARGEDDTGVQSITFTVPETTEETPFYCNVTSAGTLEVRFPISMEYKYSYKTYQGWFNPTLVTGENTGSVQPRFYYSYVDGEFKLFDLENYNASFYYY